MKRSLQDFDYRKHRLFAFAEGEVVLYEAREQAGFFRESLIDPAVAKRDPMLRLSLAKAAGVPELIPNELKAAVHHLAQTAPTFVGPWYSGQ